MSGESHDLGNVASLAALAGYGDGYVQPGDEIYVVTEDCDYIYRNTGSNPVADGFNVIKALFLPGIWERRGGSAGSTSLRFNTVATGLSGSGRLIDAGVSGLVDGVSVAWVESVKDSWRWDATSTLTADNITVCNPTANGANPGRFIRKLIPAPEWLQQASWFVSTAGNDENDGNTALTPVKTDVEIGRRWGVGKRAQISVPVTITYAQSPTTQSNLLFEMLATGSLTFVGTPTVTKTGTVLTAVTVQNRATPVRWAIAAGAILDATDLGKIYVITASGTPANVGAYALAMKDNGANVITVSPFGTYDNATGVFTAITPGVGDTIEVRDMRATTLTGNIEGYGVYTGTQLGTAKVLFDSVHLASAGGASMSSSTRACGVAFVYARATFASIVLSGPSFNNASNHFWRGAGGIPGCVMAIRGSASLTMSQMGAIDGFLTTARGTQIVTSSDCYFQNMSVAAAAAGPMVSNGCAFFDRAVASNGLLVASGVLYQQTGAVPDWGTNNAGFGLVVQSGGCYSYATKPTVNGGLGAGRESSIGGVDTQYAAYPATGAVNLTNFAAAVLTA
jgi:hypothetical protein